MALIDTAAATDGFSFPVRAGFVSERLRSVRGMSIGSVTYLRPIGGVKGGPTGRVSEAGWEVAAILRRPPIFLRANPRAFQKSLQKRNAGEAKSLDFRLFICYNEPDYAEPVLPHEEMRETEWAN